MKDFVKIGNRWFNHSHITFIETTTAEPPAVKIQIETLAGPQMWDLVGDDAEAVLKELGHDKDHREKVRAAALKEAKHAEELAAKEAEKEAKEAAKAEEEAHHARAHHSKK